jgi:hypothetical protein
MLPIAIHDTNKNISIFMEHFTPILWRTVVASLEEASCLLADQEQELEQEPEQNLRDKTNSLWITFFILINSLMPCSPT